MEDFVRTRGLLISDGSSSFESIKMATQKPTLWYYEDMQTFLSLLTDRIQKELEQMDSVYGLQHANGRWPQLAKTSMETWQKMVFYDFISLFCLLLCCVCLD